ncbi:hypothetical protein [uncultured Cohaesibacter sp.]|uniref:hypothetical protein n=1 Tax=uncultured Cohaesibacter sp. TaxID=1002546 RepID=UPI002AABD71E|nr:hypothetical protein [uncultured Cohaesibacter sp.]
MSMSVESSITGSTRPPLSTSQKSPNAPFSLGSENDQTSAETGASNGVTFPSVQAALSDGTAQALLEMQQAASSGNTPSQKTAPDTIAKSKPAHTASLVGQQSATHENDASSQKAASAAPAIEQANGLDIMTSGHSLDAREGVSLFHTIDGSQFDKEAANALAEATDGNYALTVISTTPVGPLPEGATSSYADINLFRTDGTNKLLFSMDLDDMRGYVNKHVDELVDVINAENELQAKYGDDVKLIYSHPDGGYIMLTPDDAQYDDHDFASDAIGKTLAHQSGQSTASELILRRLEEYGYV